MQPSAQTTARFMLGELFIQFHLDMQAAVQAGDTTAALEKLALSKGRVKELYGRDPAEFVKWATLAARRAPTEQAFLDTFRALLNLAKGETLQKLGAAPASSPADLALGNAEGDDLGPIFDLARWKQGLQIKLSRLSLDAFETAGADQLAQLGVKSAFAAPAPEVLKFIRTRANLLSNIADDIHADIQRVVAEGVAARESVAQISARVTEAFDDISAGRAKTIALNETSAAFGKGAQEAIKQSGIKFKRWITSGLGNVRDAHLAASGQTVPVDEPFVVDGEELMFPGDSERGAGPENTINCRCISVAVESPDSEVENAQ